MTKYLLYNSRLVRPEMEKPILKHYAGGGEIFSFGVDKAKYDRHLSTLPGIECSEELLAKFKDGQELIEGKDFATEPRPVCHGRHSTMELVAVPVQSDEEENVGEWADFLLQVAQDYAQEYGMTDKEKCNFAHTSGKAARNNLAKYQSQYKLTKR